MKKKAQGKTQKIFVSAIMVIMVAVASIFGYSYHNTNDMVITSDYIESNSTVTEKVETTTSLSFELDEVPEYSEYPYVYINNNIPDFDADELTTEAFETYSELDNLGRCGVAYANICTEIMPADDEERESISEVTPTGWVQAEYDDIDNGGYLYNRCHLIGYQLAGENANENNLITGTRYLNIEGMLDFENYVAEYIEENPDNHVLYRVTPVFEDDNLLASGVQIEAYSVEDAGSGVCFNVYCYNVQPGIEIDYTTGESWEE